MPGKFDLDVYAGDRTTVYLDGIVDADGVAVDYTTGWSFLAEIAADRQASTVETATFTVTAPAAGSIRAVLPASESAKLRALLNEETPGRGEAQWDLQLTPTSDPEGVMTLLSGKVKITGDVSRA